MTWLSEIEDTWDSVGSQKHVRRMARVIRELAGYIKAIEEYSGDVDKFLEIYSNLSPDAKELLENDIPMKQGDGWISVEEQMPTEDALYLIHAPSLDPDKPFIKTAWFDPDIVLGWQFIPKVWSDAVTHWMPLPEPPSIMENE